MSQKNYISVSKAYDLVVKRSHSKATLKFPYKIQYKDSKDRTRKSDNIPLIFLMNAITLTKLKHPETEDTPKPIDIKSIESCYIMGSAVKPEYEKVVKKYLFGLYTSEKEVRILPNDIDILCLTNNTGILSHIKSMTNWDVEISSTYSSYKVPKYASFDISFYPVSYKDCGGNYDFIKHIEDYGVCMMGSNIIGAKRYAGWHHNTIRDEIVCTIPKSPNISPEQLVEEEKISRFEMMDL